MRAVWIAYDKAGIMVAHKMIPEKLVMETYYGSIIASWEKLEPYIKAERAKNRPAYQIHFEKLYNLSLRYRDKKYPRV